MIRHHKYTEYDSQLGVSQVAGATDEEYFGFFQAAYEFVTSKVWMLLKQTKKRQFGLSLSIPPPDINPNNPPKLLDTVQLHSLTSKQGKLLNGQRGEIVPPLPTTRIGHADTRWQVRLFRDGRIIRCKRSSVRVVAGDECVVKVNGADGGSVYCCYYHYIIIICNPPHTKHLLTRTIESLSLTCAHACRQHAPLKAIQRRHLSQLGCLY